MKCGKLHLIASSTSGQASCTISRMSRENRLREGRRLLDVGIDSWIAFSHISARSAQLSVTSWDAVPVDPVAPEHEQPHRLRRPGDRGLAWRRRTEHAGEIHRHHEDRERPQADRTGPIARRRVTRRYISRPAANTAPSTASVPAANSTDPRPRRADPQQHQRHVGAMCHVVEQPMAHHQCAMVTRRGEPRARTARGRSR